MARPQLGQAGFAQLEEALPSRRCQFIGSRRKYRMGRVIIGMDPHKRSATVEIIDGREKVLTQGRFGTDRDGYAAMLKLGRQHKDRVWAVEGCNGIGRHIAQRLVADGETVLDVPAKLSARARLFDTAQGRKTDPADAHCVAVAALRANGLRQVVVDDVTAALKLLVDRRDGLGRARTEALSRLHHLLLELVPGRAKQFLSAPQARALLNTVRPRDIVGRMPASVLERCGTSQVGNIRAPSEHPLDQLPPHGCRRRSLAVTPASTAYLQRHPAGIEAPAGRLLADLVAFGEALGPPGGTGVALYATTRIGSAVRRRHRSSPAGPTCLRLCWLACSGCDSKPRSAAHGRAGLTGPTTQRRIGTR
jgi:hypothetical protein